MGNHFYCAETLPGAAQESRMTHQPGAPLAAGTARQITICAITDGSRYALNEKSGKRPSGMFPAITAGWVPPTGGMVRPFCSAAWSEPFQPPPASSGLELYVPWGFGCCGKGTAGSWKNIPESLAPGKTTVPIFLGKANWVT